MAANYYNSTAVQRPLSKAKSTYIESSLLERNLSQIVSILAYCIMPDHYHLLVKLNTEYPLSKYVGNFENSFTKYFNKLHWRKGPLWQNRFRSVLISDNNTLLHVHRYIHLNPTTANLVTHPEDWELSSYKEYITNPKALTVNTEISIQSIEKYKEFVANQIDYQRNLKRLKKELLE